MMLSILGSGSSGNTYLLHNESEALVIEAGIHFQKVMEALNFNVSIINLLVYSHVHKDHSKFSKEYKKRFIPTYGPDELSHNKSFKVGNFTIKSLEIVHDVECYGFLIHHHEMGNLAYFSDTQHIPYNIPKMNHLLIEANFDNQILDNHVLNGHLPAFVRQRVMNSHLSLEGCKKFLEMNDLSEVNNIVLIHLSDGNSNAKVFQKEITGLTGKEVFIADKGMNINFNKEPF